MSLRKIVLVSAIGFFASCSSDGEESIGEGVDLQAPAGAVTLRVMSYNINLLAIDRKSDFSCRSPKIADYLGERLKNPEPRKALDIVALQELFAHLSADAIARETGHDLRQDYIIRPPPGGLIGASGGLATLPNTRFCSQDGDGDGLVECNLSSEEMVFSDCGPWDTEMDCGAQKGVLYSLVKVSDALSINVFNTHLNAGDTARDISARQSQLQELSAFANRILALDNRSQWPTLIMGDFNVEDGFNYDPTQVANGVIKNLLPNGAQYLSMMSILRDPINGIKGAGVRDSLIEYFNTAWVQRGYNLSETLYKRFATSNNCRVPDTNLPSWNCSEYTRDDYIFVMDGTAWHVGVGSAYTERNTISGCEYPFLSNHRALKATLHFWQ